MDRVLEAERLGFAEVWTGEAYGTDAVTPVAWILARTTRIKAGTGIMQMHARTPTMAAMTAISLQHLSGDRFLCGVGVSGPQVVEGWHGVPYGKPMLRTKEYIAIMRQVLERKAPLEFHGEHYDIPYRGAGCDRVSPSRCAASRTAILGCRSTPPPSRRPGCVPRARSPTGCCRSSIRPNSRGS